jgi:GNAT superfamily N-acetyltransferase
MSDTVQLKRVTGPQVEPYLDDLARLRITVFRDFPYLYDGDVAYERQYLQTYAQAPASLFVLAMAGEDVVGAATGVPLADAEQAFQQPLRDAGFAAHEVFYFGESVLLPAWRGRGIGHGFFDHREDHARGLPGIATAAFCAVERPEDHPDRPADYSPLHALWRKRGFTRRPDITTTYTWKDVGDPHESAKPMIFWLKPLR